MKVVVKKFLLERFSPSVRKVVPQLQQRPPSTSKSDRMVQQVKDVLPQVPISVIRKDICMLSIEDLSADYN